MKIFGLRSILVAFTLAACSFLSVAPASAQATRTWISGVGDDVNPCSRTAPCKTFAGAISKTAATGEINCLDSGGFGGVTITKSITLSCEGVTGGILVASTNGITINAGPTDVVRIRGLDIEGLSTIGGSLNGINFLNGAALYVTNTKINGFGGAGSSGFGISFTPTSVNAVLVVDNVELIRNGNASAPSTSGGLLIQPAAGLTASVSVTNSVVANNTNTGIRADTTSKPGAIVNLAVSNTVLTNNGTGILAKADTGQGTVTVIANNLTVSQNASSGIRSAGATAAVVIGNSTITGNAVGVSASGGGLVNSYGNNRLNGNTTDGAFTGITPQQ